MKKRTAVIGYTKVCKRLDELARDPKTSKEHQAQISAYVRNTLALAQARHAEFNSTSNAMSRFEHDIRKSTLDIVV